MEIRCCCSIARPVCVEVRHLAPARRRFFPTNLCFSCFAPFPIKVLGIVLLFPCCFIEHHTASATLHLNGLFSKKSAHPTFLRCASWTFEADTNLMESFVPTSKRRTMVMTALNGVPVRLGCVFFFLFFRFFCRRTFATGALRRLGFRILLLGNNWLVVKVVLLIWSLVFRLFPIRSLPRSSILETCLIQAGLGGRSRALRPMCA